MVSDEARNNLPEELRQGLVLTIYEAKGLEFDDILPYNFFKDFEMRDSRPVYFRSDHLRSQKS